MMMTIFTVIALIILAVFAICRFLLGPRAQLWFSSSGEEKIGLSKNKLYNANGYIVSTFCGFFFVTISGVHVLMTHI